MDHRRTRISIWYFLLAFLLLIALNTFFASMRPSWCGRFV
jgi:hypothetical protein